MLSYRLGGTAVDPRSAGYARNDAVQQGLVGELRSRQAAATLGGPERSRQRHVERGKLLPACR